MHDARQNWLPEGLHMHGSALVIRKFVPGIDCQGPRRTQSKCLKHRNTEIYTQTLHLHGTLLSCKVCKTDK